MQFTTLSDTSFDVVVVGARLAGAATALLLARRGLRVAVLERAHSIGDTLSTHALMRGGVVQLQRWGLLERVRAAGTPPVRSTTFTYPHSTVVIPIEPGGGVDALYAPRRSVLDPLLAAAAVEAGADIRYGARVTGLITSGDGRVSGVTGVAPDGAPFSVSARFVVGADGIHSTVARLVRAPVEHQGRFATATTYGYWSDASTQLDGYEWIFHPDAAAGAIPTNADQVCVFANATPARIRRGGVEVIESILRTTAPRVAEQVLVGRPPAATRVFHAPAGFLRKAWGDGWALVGDAGYFKDPISAHGMTDALRDAELLARAFADIFDGADERAALAEYQQVRDRMSLPLLEVADRIASHQWDGAEIEDLLKSLAGAMRNELRVISGLGDETPRAAGARAA